MPLKRVCVFSSGTFLWFLRETKRKAHPILASPPKWSTQKVAKAQLGVQVRVGSPPFSLARFQFGRWQGIKPRTHQNVWFPFGLPQNRRPKQDAPTSNATLPPSSVCLSLRSAIHFWVQRVPHLDSTRQLRQVPDAEGVAKLQRSSTTCSSKRWHLQMGVWFVCLFVWLVGWLFVRSFVRLCVFVGWLAGFFACLFVSLFVCLFVCVCLSVGCLVGWLVGGRSVGRLVGWWVGWWVGWLVARSVGSKGAL